MEKSNSSSSVDSNKDTTFTTLLRKTNGAISLNSGRDNVFEAASLSFDFSESVILALIEGNISTLDVLMVMGSSPLKEFNC